MANEITLTASLSVYKPSIMTSAVGRSVNGATFTMAGIHYIESSMVAALSATLIPMGQVASPHFSYFKNLDATNYVTIFNGVSGAIVLRLLPGEANFVTLDPSGTYYALANTATVQLEYFVCDA